MIDSGSGNDDQKKGLEFMALKFSLIDRRLELAISKQITPAENNLLTIIELGTIGARNAKKQICSRAEFDLESLSQKMGYKKINKLWVILSSLTRKGLLHREHTRIKGVEILGLNPGAFGQILIDTHDHMEKKRHLSLVVDKPAYGVDNSEAQHPDRRFSTHGSSVANTRSVCEQHTDRVLKEIQVADFIDPKTPLDSYKCNLNSFRGKKEVPDETNQEGKWDPKGPEQARKIRQLIQSTLKSLA